MRKRLFIGTMVAAAISLSAIGAAGTLTLNSGASKGVNTSSYFIGAINMTYNDGITNTTFFGFCLDRTQSANWGVGYVPTTLSSLTGHYAYIVNTYAANATVVNSKTNDQLAAAQVAIWDLVNGGIDHSWNSGAGYGLSASILSTATDIYNEAIKWNGTAIKYTTEQNGIQNFVGPDNSPGSHLEPVPEPFTMSLGIAGCALAIRRRVKKAA